MEKENMEQMFALTVEDYGFPSFVSGDISYLGNWDNLEDFLANIPEKHREIRLNMEELFQRFLNGEEELRHNVAFWERRVLTPVKIYGASTDYYEELAWENLNTWECAYDFFAKKVQIAHIWVSFSKEEEMTFGRYCKLDFGEIKMNGKDLENWMEPWGYPGLLAFRGNGRVASTLYLPERIFEDEAELLADKSSPVFEPENDLREFLFAIVADG